MECGFICVRIYYHKRNANNVLYIISMFCGQFSLDLFCSWQGAIISCLMAPSAYLSGSALNKTTTYGSPAFFTLTISSYTCNSTGRQKRKWAMRVEASLVQEGRYAQQVRTIGPCVTLQVPSLKSVMAILALPACVSVHLAGCWYHSQCGSGMYCTTMYMCEPEYKCWQHNNARDGNCPGSSGNDHPHGCFCSMWRWFRQHYIGRVQNKNLFQKVGNACIPYKYVGKNLWL